MILHRSSTQATSSSSVLCSFHGTIPDQHDEIPGPSRPAGSSKLHQRFAGENKEPAGITSRDACNVDRVAGATMAEGLSACDLTETMPWERDLFLM